MKVIRKVHLKMHNDIQKYNDKESNLVEEIGDKGVHHEDS